MTPGVYDLRLYRGDTARWEFVLWHDAARTVPVNLAGATAAGQIRDNADSGQVIAELVCTISGNTVSVTLPTDAAANLHPRGMWDLQLTWPSGDVQTVVSGGVYVRSDVTRAVA